MITINKEELSKLLKDKNNKIQCFVTHSNKVLGTNSAAVGGLNNNIPANLKNVVILGMVDKEATDDDTVYVENLDVSGESTIYDLIVIHDATIGNNLEVVNNGSFGSIKVGNVISPTSIFEVKDLIKFDNTLKNTFIGFESGILTTAKQNTFVGYNAGKNNTTGVANNFFGKQAGEQNISGSINQFIGKEAGRYNISGSTNCAIGGQALKRDTSPNNCIAIGNNALQDSQNNLNNIGIGVGALNGVTSANAGLYNIGIGYQAAHINTGDYNIYIGDETAPLNVGDNNIGIGYQAAYSNTSGHSNTFIGNKAGYSNQIGNQNVFIGYNAGYNETSSNKLYISNSNTQYPLIYGEFDNDFIKINGGLRSKITTVNTTTYNILSSDKIVSVNYTTTGACTITLPEPADGMDYIIKDAGGNATTNTITVNPNGTETIDGATSYSLNSNYDAIRLYSDGTNWFII